MADVEEAASLLAARDVPQARSSRSARSASPMRVTAHLHLQCMCKVVGEDRAGGVASDLDMVADVANRLMEVERAEMIAHCEPLNVPAFLPLTLS